MRWNYLRKFRTARAGIRRQRLDIFSPVFLREAEIAMSTFSWIPEIPDAEWSETLRGKRFVRMTHTEFAGRCGSPNGAPLRNAFWSWASKQSRSYALVWTPGAKEGGDIQVVMRVTPP
jgi:hypothetical protein